MRHIVSATILILLSLTVPALAAGSGGGGGGGGGGMPSGGSSSAEEATPEQIAAASYRAGMRHKEKAWKFEARAAKEEKESKRERLLAKATNEYKRAVSRQNDALAAVSGFYDAANELGYALRKSGKPLEAVDAYNWALKLKPDFAEAKEYKGEALLALGRFEETKAIYMDLFRTDLEHAAMLMSAMEAWVAERGNDSTVEEREFADWVAERKMAAQVTQSARSQSAEPW